MPDLSMHRIGEVHRGRTGGQVNHVTLGGKGKNLLGRKVIAQGIQELVGVCSFLLPIQQLTHPRHLVHFFLVARILALSFLITPVGGHAKLRVIVHLVRAHLHLKGGSARPNHGGMQ